MKTILSLLVCALANAAEPIVYGTRIFHEVPNTCIALSGEVMRVLPNGIVVQEVTKREIRASRPPANYQTGTGQLSARESAPGRLIEVQTERGKKFFLENAPDQFRAEGRQLAVKAMPSGTISVEGSVLERYDHGRPPNASERETLAKEAAESAKWRADQLASRQARQNLDRQAQTARVAVYQLAQASNGLPSFQIEVAKRYMRGDGLELNKALAKFWLESACTNRESEATNLLKSLERGQSSHTTINPSL